MEASSGEALARRQLRRRRSHWFRVGVMLGVPCGVVLALLPRVLAMNYHAKRAEVPTILDELRGLQLAHHAAHGTWAVPAEAWPRTVAELGKRAVDAEFPEDWRPLEEAFPGKVRGVYWIRAVPGGDAVLIQGMIDIDADGRRAWYVATNQAGPYMVTPDAFH